MSEANERLILFDGSREGSPEEPATTAIHVNMYPPSPASTSLRSVQALPSKERREELYKCQYCLFFSITSTGIAGGACDDGNPWRQGSFSFRWPPQGSPEEPATTAIPDGWMQPYPFGRPQRVRYRSELQMAIPKCLRRFGGWVKEGVLKWFSIFFLRCSFASGELVNIVWISSPNVTFTFVLHTKTQPALSKMCIKDCWSEEGGAISVCWKASSFQRLPQGSQLFYNPTEPVQASKCTNQWYYPLHDGFNLPSFAGCKYLLLCRLFL